MRKLIYSLFVSTLLLLFNSCTPKHDQLLLSGSGWDKIIILKKSTKQIVWEYPLSDGWECNSVAATPDGNILFSYSKGAKLIDKDKKEIWNINAPAGCEVQTAKVLPDGNYMIAWCGNPASILELTPKGEILSRTDFDTQIRHSHSQFRQVTKNSNGNYMVPLFASSEVREISPTGSTIKAVKVEGNPFCAVPLKNNNWLVSGGDAHCYMEINFNTGEIIKKVNADDIEGAKLFFVAELLPTHSGGLYICNWQGHGGGNDPQLIELDHNGKMIWNLNDNAAFGMISSICPID